MGRRSDGVARTLADLLSGITSFAPRILKAVSVVSDTTPARSAAAKSNKAKRAGSASPSLSPAATPPVTPSTKPLGGRGKPPGRPGTRQGQSTRRGIRWDESGIERVREFDKFEPTATVAVAPVYALASDSEIVKQRARRRISEEEVGRGAQAFHLVYFDQPGSAPRRVDTRTLTAKELRAELSARGLPTAGARMYLQARLDQHLLSHGAAELESAGSAADDHRHHGDDVAASGASSTTPMLIDDEEEDVPGRSVVEAAAGGGGAPVDPHRVAGKRHRPSRSSAGTAAVAPQQLASLLPPRPRTRGATAAAAGIRL